MSERNGTTATRNRRAWTKRVDLVRWLVRTSGGKLTRQDDYGTFEVLRLDLPDGEKTFRPIHRIHVDGRQRWFLGYPDGPRPLFHRDRLDGGDLVLIVEGEKSAEAAERLGFVATCCAGGARAVGKTDWTALAGRLVAILPDNDQAGKSYAQAVCDVLGRLDGTTVKVVELPGLPPKGDIADWAGTAAELAGLINRAAAWERPPSIASNGKRLSIAPWEARRRQSDTIPDGDLRQRIDAVDLEQILDQDIGRPDRSRKRTCPFHDDQRPSLTTFRGEDGRQRFKCFVCGAGGDVVEYTEKRQGVGFLEALDRLGLGHKPAYSTGQSQNLADGCYRPDEPIGTNGKISRQTREKELFSRYPDVPCERPGWEWKARRDDHFVAPVGHRCRDCLACRTTFRNRKIRAALLASDDLGGEVYLDRFRPDQRKARADYLRRQAGNGEKAAGWTVRQEDGRVVGLSRERPGKGRGEVVSGEELERVVVEAIDNAPRDRKKTVSTTAGWGSRAKAEPTYVSIDKMPGSGVNPTRWYCHASMEAILRAARQNGLTVRTRDVAGVLDRRETIEVGPFTTAGGEFDHKQFREFASDCDRFQVQLAFAADRRRPPPDMSDEEAARTAAFLAS